MASYDGTPGRSLSSILRQEDLAGRLADFVRKRKQKGLANEHVFVEVQRFVDEDLLQSDPELADFARRRFKVQPRPLAVDVVYTASRILRGAGARASALVVLTFLALVVTGVVFGRALNDQFRLEGSWTLLVPFSFGVLTPLAATPLIVMIWSLLLQQIEKRDGLRWIPVPDREFREHDQCLRERENEGSGRINRMNILTDVKPGFIRKVVMSVVLGIISFRALRNLDGVLQGLQTIHFAQWRLIDRGRRLLFMSNYDGEALGYFREFSENAAPGVNAIWSNTEGFPPTRNLIGDGARNLEAFENAARVHQIATDAWYCGYPDRRHDTVRINENFRIHELLNSFPPPGKVDWWIEALARRRS